MSGYVYIFDVGNGCLKLGTSLNWKSRMAELRYWHKDISLVQTWVMGSRSAARVERAAHLILKKKKTERIGNEIYKASKSVVISAVREARKYIADQIGLSEHLDHNKGHEYTNKEIMAAFDEAQTIRGAARILGCATITIKRRMEAM